MIGKKMKHFNPLMDKNRQSFKNSAFLAIETHFETHSCRFPTELAVNCSKAEYRVGFSPA